MSETGSHVPEPTSTLLVHLSTRGNTIDSHKENLAWFYHSKQHLSNEAHRKTTNTICSSICVFTLEQLAQQQVGTTIHTGNERTNKQPYLNVVENISKDLLFCNSKMRIFIFRVWAHMNNSIHIQIQIVELWKLKSYNAQLYINMIIHNNINRQWGLHNVEIGCGW